MAKVTILTPLIPGYEPQAFAGHLTPEAVLKAVAMNLIGIGLQDLEVRINRISGLCEVLRDVGQHGEKVMSPVWSANFTDMERMPKGTFHFRFKDDARPVVEKLCEVWEKCNQIDRLADQRGPYGWVQQAVRKIVEVECGADVAKEVMDHMSYGGSGSWVEDLEDAVCEAKRYLAENEARDEFAELYHDS